MANASNYRLGSIWIVKFEPSVGTEIRKTRPGLIISGTIFNEQRTKITVLPFTSARSNDPRISPALVFVPSSPQNGLNTDSLLVCVDPMTFDKSRMVQQVGELETELLNQAQDILRRYLLL
ncbi:MULTISPECIES: type II toxin-antitoxin system PemK/MazF family toxin [Kamptonema]|uniref:type II toxin-antitoxin system PemK/MazF family toxin n=1 Tax=Kamptonema TaxID=1501433 RepID=UPI00037B2FAB|nr:MULTISPECIES: type II toxin-antitoxin system PemK/MazF family toxin [Kamptonema]